MKVWLVGCPERWWDTSAVYDNEEAARAHAALCHLDLTEDEVLSAFDPIARGLCPGCGTWDERHREGCPEFDWEAERRRKEREAVAHERALDILEGRAVRGDTRAREALSSHAGEGDKSAKARLAAHDLDARYVS